MGSDKMADKGKRRASIIFIAAIVWGTICFNTGLPPVDAPNVCVADAARKMTTTKSTATTKKTTKATKSKAKKKTEINKKKKIAQKYVGKKLSALVRAVGKYKRITKAQSCYYENEYDGIIKFDGFSVYGHTKNRTVWYVDIVE